MTCKCIVEINARLMKGDVFAARAARGSTQAIEGPTEKEKERAKNTHVDSAISFMTGRVYADLATSKRDKKNPARPLVVVATFCPFCGKRYHK